MIDDFFATLASGRSAATVRRYVRVRYRLICFLDAAAVSDADGQIDTAQLVERLPAFLDVTALPEGATEARTQVSVVSRLVQLLLRERLVSKSLPGETLADIYRAIERARHHIDARDPHPSASNSTMPSRFLQRPGAQW